MSHAAHVDDFVPCNVCGNCLTCDPHESFRCVGKFDFEMYRTDGGVITTRPKAMTTPKPEPASDACIEADREENARLRAEIERLKT